MLPRQLAITYTMMLVCLVQVVGGCYTAVTLEVFTHTHTHLFFTGVCLLGQHNCPTLLFSLSSILSVI